MTDDDVEESVEHLVGDEDGQHVGGEVGRLFDQAVDGQAEVDQQADDEQRHPVDVHRPEPVGRTGLEVVPAHQVDPLEHAHIFVHTVPEANVSFVSRRVPGGIQIRHAARDKTY